MVFILRKISSENTNLINQNSNGSKNNGSKTTTTSTATTTTTTASQKSNNKKKQLNKDGIDEIGDINCILYVKSSKFDGNKS